jgi:predicted alpha/beta-hydrolase family hydrolase
VSPRAAPRLGVLLAPGAGSGRDQPTLVAIERAVAAHGAAVVRMDFPYRIAGRRAPDRAPVLVAAVRKEAARLSRRTPALVAGGRSMGGRMCSLAVAQGLAASGLVLISYPLHPPGRPDKLRSEHFADLRVPCLFVSGTRDAFGSTAELEEAAAAIPGAVTVHWIEGSDHALRGRDAEVAEVVVGWLRSAGLLGGQAGESESSSA